jgi:4-hydroxybenzoate polyprenyltransferase
LKQIRQFLAFLLYSNLFIAFCAVLMVNQSARLLTGQSPQNNLVGFVFFSTLCSYNFHYYLTFHSVLPSERIKWAATYRWIHAVFFLIGLAGAAYFGYKLLPHWPWLVPDVVATFLYSAPKIPHWLFRSLRKVAIGKTIFLAFLWMYVTTVLPVVVVDGPLDSTFFLFVTSRFFLIYAICVLFDCRDREDDKAAGVRSLITYLDDYSVRALFFCSIAVFGLSTIALVFHGFRLVDMLIILIPGIIVAFSYEESRRNFSDVYYYFFLDGMMALSALLMLIPGI